MCDVFEQWLEDEAASDGLHGILRVWRTTFAEFIPTLLREHSEIYAVTVRPVLAIRILIASLLPVGAYVSLMRYLAHSDGFPVIATWFALMAIGMARARGRGWACSRNAMLSAVLGIGLPLLWEGITTVSTPSLFIVAPLLIATAATIGLILSTYVRLVMEGLTLPAAMPIQRGTYKSLGFSLPELLIVIGIIGLLLAILLPVMSSVRKAARDTACLANVHDLGRSYQMYLNGNRGKSFIGPQDVTGLAWYELLQPYTGDLTRILLCPDATEPGDAIGSASKAWGPLRTYVTAAPQWTVRGTYVGSYGFNGWLCRIPSGQAYPPDVQARYIDLPAQHADSVPILADCIEHQGLPLDTDTVPTNLEHPLPTSESGLPGPTGFMAYFCIDRHRRAVNVVFLDGHAARVPLQELWKLQWNRSFTTRDVVIPP
jgi:prepilin-type N-terminal cleavage/methylation domain-containing protein/prepilin-type processing-associated H-X9-DG protein